MRIVNLQAENIKRLRAVEVTPSADVVIISGRNGQGKTSVLDSIWYALAGAAATGRPGRSPGARPRLPGGGLMGAGPVTTTDAVPAASTDQPDCDLVVSCEHCGDLATFVGWTDDTDRDARWLAEEHQVERHADDITVTPVWR